MSIMGTRVVRVEDPAFLSRGARYTDDLDLVGALHLTLVRSPLAHARIEAIDVGEARSAPGVVGVFTGADVDLEPALLFGGANEEMVRRVPGEGRGAVRRRAGRRRPHRGGLPGPGRRRPGRGRLRPAAGRRRPQGRRHRRGAAVPRGGHQHVQRLRPRRRTSTRTSSTAARSSSRGSWSTSGSPRPRWRPAPPPRSGATTAASPSGAPRRTRRTPADEVAGWLGIDAEQVRVITPDVGGGFGAKIGADPEFALVAWLAKQVGRPGAVERDPLGEHDRDGAGPRPAADGHDRRRPRRQRRAPTASTSSRTPAPTPASAPCCRCSRA